MAYESGNFTWSYSLLQEAARQRANDPSILHDLAWAAYSLGKINEARDAMQKVLTTGPDSPQAADAKKFLALTALDENPKELTAAEGEVQKELKSNPEYVPALMAQAALDAQRGQTKPATEIYSDILRRWPISRLRRNASLRCMLKIHPQSLPPMTWPQKRARHYRTIPDWPSFLDD